MKLTQDYEHDYIAVNGFPARAYVRAFVPEVGESGGPVVIMTDPDDGPSVTNNVEVLGAEVATTLGLDAGGVFFIEHYSPRRGVRWETFDKVTFSPAEPREVLASGRWRPQLGQPDWRPIDRAEVESLVGAQL